MISETAIQEWVKKHQTTELNVRREYAQHLFLSYFYRQPESEKIYFKGGTALRILYQSPRFSEDLDFSTPLKNVKPLENAILETLVEIEREGAPCVLKEAKTTTGGYLAILQFEIGGVHLIIQLEISLRDQPRLAGEMTTVVSDFIPAYTVTHLAQKQLVAQKIQALIQRQKPRDFYDLYFMLRANLMTPEDRKMLHQASELLKLSKISFERELKQFLPKSHWPLIRDFPATLNRELQRFL